MCLIFSGCISIKPIYYEQEIKKADLAVGNFHQLLNEEKYEELYNLTDEGARAIKSKTAFLELMKQVHLQLGNVLNSTKTNEKATSQALSTKIELTYRTKFERSEQKEKFIWIVDDKGAGLFSYEIVQ